MRSEPRAPVPITATRVGGSSRAGSIALVVNAAPAVPRNVRRVMDIGKPPAECGVKRHLVSQLNPGKAIAGFKPTGDQSVTRRPLKIAFRLFLSHSEQRGRKNLGICRVRGQRHAGGVSTE